MTALGLHVVDLDARRAEITEALHEEFDLLHRGIPNQQQIERAWEMWGVGLTVDVPAAPGGLTRRGFLTFGRAA